MNIIGKKVRVYRNLHKQCFSVVDVSTGKVILRTKQISLSNVTFKVRENGRQKVLKDKQKNVHAFVCGTVVEDILETDGFETVSYNPYKFGYFFNQANLDKISDAFLAKLINGKDVMAKM